MNLGYPTKEEIDLITFDEEIWKKTADDLCQKDFELPYEKFEFLGAYLEEKIIGLASIEKDGRFHFEVLKPYRRCAREILALFLNQLQRPIYCAIPTIHKSVINFAKKNGFQEVGILEERFLKNGINYPRIKLEYDKISR